MGCLFTKTKNNSNNNNDNNNNNNNNDVKNPVNTLSNDSIVLINFIDLKKLKKIPRYPDNAKICIDINDIDLKKSLLIFISHNWFKISKTTYPDNSNNNKYELIIKGIEFIQSMAPGINKNNVFIWIDYGCINQNNLTQREFNLKHLDKIIQSCDVMYTPMHDNEWKEWQIGRIGNSLYDKYKANLWNSNDENAYLNRSWTRLEMHMCMHIPLHESIKDKVMCFNGSLSTAIRGNRRPHFLFGTKELNENLSPLSLPPLYEPFPNDYDPMKGFITKKDDLVVIEEWINKLKEMKMNESKSKIGYSGERDASGRKNGHGIEIFQNGNVYDGQWTDNKMEGKGKLIFTNGNIYEGEFKDSLMNGVGVLTMKSGSTTVYKGNFLNSKMHGEGVLEYRSGNVYKGNFDSNILSGQGQLTFSSTGNIYIGEFLNGKMNGPAKLTFHSGDIFEGNFLNDKIIDGTMTFADGGFYLGGFGENTKRHGKGEYRFPNGDRYNGDWVDGRMNGEGSFHFANGDIYVGDYIDDKKCGNGTLTYANGDKYVGMFNNNEKHGRGTYFYNDGRTVKGIFEVGEFAHI